MFDSPAIEMLRLSGELTREITRLEASGTYCSPVMRKVAKKLVELAEPMDKDHER